MMILAFAIITATSQADALFTGTVPADIPTFSVTLGGMAPFYAAMQINGQWVTDRNQEIKPTQDVEFVPDIPYRTHEVVRVAMRKAEISYEAPAMRRERLAAAWKSMGYTFLETASGWSAVREQDIQLAERARTMAQQIEARTRNEAQPMTAQEALPDASGQSGYLDPKVLWAARAAIVCLGVLLLAGLVLVFRKRKEAWVALE